jgi:hypothetical protein
MNLTKLETEALRLDPGEKVRLAHTLVVSLGQLTPSQLRELWLQEAERRDAEIESGLVHPTIPGPAERVNKNETGSCSE